MVLLNMDQGNPSPEILKDITDKCEKAADFFVKAQDLGHSIGEGYLDTLELCKDCFQKVLDNY